MSLKLFSLCCSVFLSFCPYLSFRSFANLKLAFFLCKNFWAIKRISGPSWKSLFPFEVNYFNWVLTSLISLWWVMYEGVFKCATEGDERKSWSVKWSSLGMPPCTPNKYSRRLKHLCLGMPPCITFSINNYHFVPRSTVFLSLHALCSMLGASCSLLSSLV